MGRLTTTIGIKELVELQSAKKAHDHFMALLESLRAGGFRVIRTHGADSEYARGYWDAIGILNPATVKPKPVKKSEDDLPW